MIFSWVVKLLVPENAGNPIVATGPGSWRAGRQCPHARGRL